MSFDAATVVATAALVTALFAGFAQYRSGQNAAKKDEVSLLRDEVARLSGRVRSLEDDSDVLRQRNRLLEQYIDALHGLLRRNNIDLPPSKVFPE